MCWGHRSRYRVQKQLKSSESKSFSCPRALARIIKITGMRHAICLAVMSPGSVTISVPNSWSYAINQNQTTSTQSWNFGQACWLSITSVSVHAMEWVNSAGTSSLTHSSFLRTKETPEVMQKHPDILHTQSFLLCRINAHPFLKHIYRTFYLLNNEFTVCQETSYLPYEHYFSFQFMCMYAFMRNCVVRGWIDPNILVSLWLYLFNI